MRILLAFLFISVLVHGALLFFLPSFRLMVLANAQPQPVYIEIIPAEPPKMKPLPVLASKPKAKPEPAKPAPEIAEPLPAKVADIPVYKPAGADAPLILPDIVVPKSSMETKAEIALPDVTDIPKVQNPSKPKGAGVESELASLEKARRGTKKDDEQVKAEPAESETVQQASRIYNFDIAPTNNRLVRFVPPNPEFALENDAKVTLKFNIDKFGNTSDILFVTRSDGRVERLAYDYVRQMQFSAVINDAKDFAQITITFKVRK